MTVDRPSDQSRNPYQDEAGRPRLLPSAVAWLDILGFRDALEKARAQNEEQQLLELLAGALKELVPRMKPSLDFNPPKWVVKGFTDNFVVGFPLVVFNAPTRGMPELNIVMGRAGRFQLELAQAGFFVRGGVSVGPLYMDENLVYGAALIDAYEAETQRAREPRIILTASARAVVDEEAKRWALGPFTAPDDASLWQDSDGEVLINYLNGVVEFENEVGCDDDTFRRHGEVIRGKLIDYANDPRKRSKYEWAARYHNAFLDIRSNFPEDTRVAVESGAAFKPYPRPNGRMS